MPGTYKSPRLLVEAIYMYIEEVRKAVMRNETAELADTRSAMLVHLNEFRGMVEELGALAMRTTLDEVPNLPVGEYVAALKPLVAKFHVQLMLADRLAPALCEDLKANAAVLILVGDEKTIVRAAHDPSKPEVQLALDALLAALDTGTKQVAEDGASAVEQIAKACSRCGDLPCSCEPMCAGCDCVAGRCDCTSCV